MPILLIAAGIAHLSGQDKSQASVWDGVYSAEQAVRGEAAYLKSCTSCHGEKLEGQGTDPSFGEQRLHFQLERDDRWRPPGNNASFHAGGRLDAGLGV
jgi:mono/diheme cytochrome c family protein